MLGSNELMVSLNKSEYLLNKVLLFFLGNALKVLIHYIIQSKKDPISSFFMARFIKQLNE